IMARDLVEAIATKVKRELKVESTCKGRDLVGRRYLPPFDIYLSRPDGLGRLLAEEEATGHQAQENTVQADYEKDLAAWSSGAGRELSPNWRILPASFVEIGSGTGIVHIAPAF